jgi:hypothetical protein
MNDQLPIGYEEFRGLVVDVLRTMFSGQKNDLERAVGQLAFQQGLISASTRSHMAELSMCSYLSDKHSAWLQSILHDLYIEGVVRPGLNDGQNTEWPFFHVTDFGKEMLTSGPDTPYDPDGYIKRLKGSIHALDPVILTYLKESLHTFRIGCLLSSTISLGCASEKALLLLIGAYADALPAARKTKFKQNTENKMIKRQFDEFSKMLDSHLKARLPGDVAEDLDVALSAVFAMLRTHRNEAGHPTGKMPAREQCHASITVFPTYVRKVYGLIDWLKANSPLT